MLLLVAGIMTALTGAVHSFLGERLIFQGWRKTPPAIARRHQNIIWATWHIVSVFAFGLGYGLVWLSQAPELALSLGPILVSFSLSVGLSGLLVIYATRGRHLGGVALVVISFFIGLSTL